MTKYKVFIGKVYVMSVYADTQELALTEAHSQLSRPGRQQLLKHGPLTVQVDDRPVIGVTR